MFKLIFLTLLFGFILRIESSGVNQSLSEFQQEALKVHNSYREKHGAEPLTLDSDLNSLAIKWAQYLGSSGKLEVQRDELVGVNIFMSPGTTVTGRTAVDSWMKEEINYDYKTGEPKNGGNTAHYTQIVWKESKKIGIAHSTTSDGSTYVVAIYSPPGNKRGLYLENVSAGGGYMDYFKGFFNKITGK